MQPRYLALLVGLLHTSASWACPACGDKLSVVGGGVDFDEVGLSKQPGSVIVFAPEGSQLQSSGKAAALVAMLRDAGHEVRLLEQDATLEQTAGEADADIVIAHWSEAGTASSRLATLTEPPTVMPVTLSADDAAAAKAAGAARCVASTEGRGLRKLPKSVDGVLERRRKGQATECQVVLASR
jgi:hypothetical protein